MQDSDGENLTSLEIYYDKLSIFSTEAAQIWAMDTDPLQNNARPVCAARAPSTPSGALQYGSGDVLYLSQTGIRSIKARDASNSGAVSDIGSPIDFEIQNIWTQRGGSDISRPRRRSLEPIVGRFWMIFPDQIFVLSYFPGPKITAWSATRCRSTSSTPSPVAGTFSFRQRSSLCLWRLDRRRVRQHGRRSAPALSGHEETGPQQVFEALDMTRPGLVAGRNSFDYSQPDVEETLGTFSSPTWRTGRAAFTGDSTHFSLRFYTTGTGPATLSNAAVHYEMADDEA